MGRVKLTVKVKVSPVASGRGSSRRSMESTMLKGTGRPSGPVIVRSLKPPSQSWNRWTRNTSLTLTVSELV